MGQANPSAQPKEARVNNLREVSLGFPKKVAQDEARRCPQCAVATCLPGCPLGIDIPGFIRFLREGEAALALERIKKDNPFPAICGRICPAPCETACIFHADGEAISIRSLERFAADYGQVKMAKQALAPEGKMVAVIGSGPSGMSAAYDLAKAGLRVTIFECMHEPGGFLRYAIPEFRLPQKILDEQFAQLKALGVQVQTDVFVGRTMTMDELFMRGFAAVLLAAGASVPRFSDLPGVSLGGVYYNTEFLARLQAKGKEDAFHAASGLVHGLNMVVLGNDPMAFDSARLGLRFGQQVNFVFAGLEEQLGVGGDILKAALEEGLVMQAPVEALAMIGDDNHFVRGVKCRKLDMIEGEGGLKLQRSSEEFILEAQTVIIAQGQRPNDFIKQHVPQLKFDEDGSPWVDGQTGMTNRDKIFACGDMVTGAGAVVDAIASGRGTAQNIIRYLGNS